MLYELRLPANGQMVPIAVLQPLNLAGYSESVLPPSLEVGSGFVKGPELDDIMRSTPLDFICDNDSE
eukprot:CAMPEP_0172629508 /NCGR_PEP_ID=MMETSP1068-20121228/168191_1 /TAXON_ID=35684 /ORGANISM="Pseudopedinella elastica, Strain CCMP716" /LENGTH=66 /DNA_ID=CAMNT_0013440063 /DNA_START=32 /DNA_END=229 /DNA_ORIENTATION=-